MEWYVKVLKNYAGFDGRAHRKEYWVFVLIHFIVCLALSLLEWIIFLPGLFTGLYGLAVLLPSLAVSVRRLHDVGKSGLWVLLSLIPVIGLIILIVFFCESGDEGENEYGPSPLTAQTN